MKSGEDAVAALLDVLNREQVPYMIVGFFHRIDTEFHVPRTTPNSCLDL